MAKPTNKKVSRAARTTGGRTARGARPWGWYTAMAIVVLLGSLGVWQSREQRLDKAAAQVEEPPKRGDHWHAALGIYVCNEYIGNIADNGRDPHGIHTHGDGIIHIHPFDSKASGKNATVGVYFETMGLDLSASKFKAPGGETWNDGEECDGKSGEVQFFVNSERRSGDPSSYRMQDRDLLVLAFVPDGHEFSKNPPSAPNLDNLSDVGPTPEVPGDPNATPTTAPGTPPPDPNATPTTAPPTSDTTATTAAP
jgi:hypothetical protein